MGSSPGLKRASAPFRPRQALTRRRLQLALGCLWLLDGALQFQPYMYERGSNGFFGPLTENTMGKPNILTDTIRDMIRAGVAHQVLFNAGIGVVQLAIGAALLLRRDSRLALAASAAWAAGVWVAGEALGQMIFPQASMLTGAPGAALVYVLCSLALWPRREDPGGLPGGLPAAGEPVSSTGILGAPIARLAWAVVWCGSALLELESGNFAANGISAQLAYSAKGEPAPIAWIDRTSAHLTAGHGTILAMIMLAVQFFVGWGALRPPTRRAAIAIGISVSLLYWVVGQDLGTLLTGQATDPNLGPVMVLFAMSLWPRRSYQAMEEALVATDPAVLESV